MRFVLSLAGLTLLYALVLASFDLWDLVIGAALSAAVLLALRRFLFRNAAAPISDLPSRMLAALPLSAAVLWEIVVGTWNVALVVLHLRPLAHPGIVAVPIEERTPLGVAVSALITTLSPGSFLVDVDWKRYVMLIHVLDASDPDAVRQAHQEFYRRYQRRVFP